MPIKKVQIIADNKKLVPQVAAKDSAGNDLVATSMEYIPEQRAWKYGTGIKVAIPKGYFGDIRARSSIYKQGPYLLANGCGVVDCGYQGEIFVIFKCVDSDWDILSDPPYEVGDRIAQLVLVPFVNIEWEEVSKFEEKTARGTGGFGSTGKGRKKTSSTSRQSTKNTKNSNS